MWHDEKEELYAWGLFVYRDLFENDEVLRAQQKLEKGER